MKLLKNKIIKVLIVLLTILLFFNYSVFAYDLSTIVVTYPPDEVINYMCSVEEYKNIDNYYVFIFMYNSSSYCINFVPKSDEILRGYFTIGTGTRMDVCFNQSFNYVQYKLDSNYNYLSRSENFSSSSGVWNIHYFGSNNNIYFGSNFNIYTDNTYTTVFTLPVFGMVVPALETAEELPKAILTTVRMMTPACLVLLGMVLVIYLIRRLRYWI